MSDTPLTYRTGEDAISDPLKSGQVDGNFRELVDRIEARVVIKPTNFSDGDDNDNPLGDIRDASFDAGNDTLLYKNSAGEQTAISITAKGIDLLAAADAEAARDDIEAQEQNDNLDGISAMTTSGITVKNGNVFGTATITTAANSGLTITNGDGLNSDNVTDPVIGVDFTVIQSQDDTLDAIKNETGTGFISRLSGGGVETRSIQTTGNGLTITNTDGASGNPTITIDYNHVQPRDNTLEAIAAIADGDTGIICRTGDGATGSATRSVTAGGGITITNGKGINGNITVRTTYAMNQDVETGDGVRFNAMGINTAIPSAGDLTIAGDFVANVSDRRLKTNIREIENPVEKLEQIRGVHFSFNKMAEELNYVGDDEIGVIAQEIQKVMPQVVARAPFDRNEDGESISGKDYLTVKYEKLTPLLIEAVKELSTRVKKLESKLKGDE